MTREVAPRPARSFWIRILPFLEPKPPQTQSSSASRPMRAWWLPKCQVSLGDVLHRHVLDLGAVLDEDLDRRVQVAGELRRRRRVLLDHRDAAARLGDDQQAPEERAALDRVDDPDEQRLLEHDVLRDVDEQAVLPLGGVVRRELLVGADELVETRMIRQRLEADALGCAVDRRARPRRRRTMPAASSSSSAGGAATSSAPLAENDSGSKSLRSVKRHDSSFVVGSGSAR